MVLERSTTDLAGADLHKDEAGFEVGRWNPFADEFCLDREDAQLILSDSAGKVLSFFTFRSGFVYSSCDRVLLGKGTYVIRNTHDSKIHRASPGEQRTFYIHVHQGKQYVVPGDAYNITKQVLPSSKPKGPSLAEGQRSFSLTRDMESELFANNENDPIQCGFFRLNNGIPRLYLDGYRQDLGQGRYCFDSAVVHLPKGSSIPGHLYPRIAQEGESHAFSVAQNSEGWIISPGEDFTMRQKNRPRKKASQEPPSWLRRNFGILLTACALSAGVTALGTCHVDPVKLDQAKDDLAQREKEIKRLRALLEKKGIDAGTSTSQEK